MSKMNKKDWSIKFEEPEYTITDSKGRLVGQITEETLEKIKEFDIWRYHTYE